MRLRTAVSAAALTAATTLSTLAVSAPAHATGWQRWEAISRCEAGGNWHINTGNGYYGGLQISNSTWGAFGGKVYHSRPDVASKAQQIRIAERIKNAQGWGAWPACASRLGYR